MNKLICWVRKNSLILLMSAITFVLFGLPLFVYGKYGAFYYRYDPEIVYIGNALLYIKAAIITYIDHPGTPTIVLLSYLYAPLRLYSKYFLQTGFIQWSFDNFDLLVYYSRIFQLTLFSTSLFIFLKAAKSATKSVYLTLFSWLVLLCLANYLIQATSVVPENLSFFLTSIWLLVFLKFKKNRTYFLSIILVFIAGFAMANKLTSLFLLVPSLIFPFFVRSRGVGTRIIMLVFNAVIAVAAFILGILPILNRFRSVIHLGSLHSDFGLMAYLSSIVSLMASQPFLFVLICSSIILAVYLVVKKQVKLIDPVVLLFFTTFLGIMVFSKYPSPHYNSINFVLLIFCTTYFFAKIRKVHTKVLLVILAGIFIFNWVIFYKTTSVELSGKAAFQRYYDANFAGMNVLWGFDNEYYTIYSWTTFWASDVFEEQFTTKPVLMLSGDLKSVKVYTHAATLDKGVFDVCWEKAYLTEAQEKIFMTLYKDRGLEVSKIPGKVNVYQVISNHCRLKS